MKINETVSAVHVSSYFDAVVFHLFLEMDLLMVEILHVVELSFVFPRQFLR
jgi:hypothetical protein